jgi:hypothetical protein
VTLGPVRNDLTVATIGTIMILVGWQMLLIPKPRRTLPLHLIVTWWGAGLVIAMTTSSRLTELSARDWTAILAGVAAVAYGFFGLGMHRRRS